MPLIHMYHICGPRGRSCCNQLLEEENTPIRFVGELVLYIIDASHTGAAVAIQIHPEVAPQDSSGGAEQ